MNAAGAFELIRRSYNANRLAHAYLIAAPKRTGIRLAERIVCLPACEGEEKPCGACRVCRQVAERTYPDAVWVEPQTKSRIISIEQIRGVQQRVQQTAFGGGWKVCVFIGADRLGVSASNAFLKTLEEPPGQTVFLLLTDQPQALLPTILSRCQYISVSEGAGAREDWAGKVLDILADAPAAGGLTAILARSDRIVRLLKALNKAAEECEKDRTAESDIEEDKDTVAARIGSRYREARGELMRLLMLWYRDLLMVVCGAEDAEPACGVSADVIRNRAENLSYRQARRNVEVVEEMSRRLEMNIPEAAVFAAGFLELRG